MNILEREDFANARRYFEIACDASREHDSVAKWALNKFGDHGVPISGCVREHFPEHVKNDLRRLAKRVSINSRIGHEECRPKRVHASTMRKLASAVAARDGSGFYGPQA